MNKGCFIATEIYRADESLKSKLLLAISEAEGSVSTRRFYNSFFLLIQEFVDTRVWITYDKDYVAFVTETNEPYWKWRVKIVKVKEEANEDGARS